AQQLVVERRPRSGRRGQPVARIAHLLRGRPPALGRRSVLDSIPLVDDRIHEFWRSARPRQQNSRKILKTKLKVRLRIRVNKGCGREWAVTAGGWGRLDRRPMPMVCPGWRAGPI